MSHTKKPSNSVILNLFQNQSKNILPFSPSPGVVRVGVRVAFTLVELIVVIVILAILSTIAFLSFNSYSSSSRDSVRLADVANLNKGIELYNVKSGYYPLPNGVISSGTIFGVEVTYKGIIGDNISKLANINKTPIDPLSSSNYVYGISYDKKYFQIGVVLENSSNKTGYDYNNNTSITTTTSSSVIANNDSYEAIQNDILSLLSIRYGNKFSMTNIEKTYSASGAGNYFSRIKGNYNGIIKFNSGSKIYLANIPSLIYNNNGSIDLLSTGTYYDFNNNTNLPYQIDSTVTMNNKTADTIIKEVTNKPTATLTGVDITSIVNTTDSTTKTNLINSTFSGVTLDSFGGDVGAVSASVSNGSIVSAPNTTAPQTLDANTNLLLHFDGNLNNSGLYTGTITNNGITYNTGKFGQAAYFNGSSYLALSDAPDFTWSSDFTIDFWVKFTDVTKTQTVFSTANDGAGFFRLFWIGTSSVWEVTDTSTYQDSSDTLQNNQWYHIVVERYNNNIKIFRDGNQVNTNRSKAITFDPDSNGFRLGSNWSTPGTFLNGYLDEFRISKGIARRTSNFSGNLPNAPY